MRLTGISRHSHILLKKVWGAAPTTEVDALCEISAAEHFSYEKENMSDIEKQSSSGKEPNDAPMWAKRTRFMQKKMEFEPLFEASSERKIRSIKLTFSFYLYYCTAQAFNRSSTEDQNVRSELLAGTKID